MQHNWRLDPVLARASRRSHNPAMPAQAGLGKNLYRRMRDCIERWRLIEPGDRLLVAVSGGKDSYCLLDLLAHYQRAQGRSFELVAVHLDQRQPGYDGEPLRRWLQDSGLDFEILQEDTFAAVGAMLEPGQTPCSLCSRLRRGVLYTAAERLGCNKLALGHHRDDALETFLMNLFFSGKLQAMPAIYRTDDGTRQVIRPLIECPEELLVRHAEAKGFPLIACGVCGSQQGLQRDEMAALLESLTVRHPNLRAVMAHALGNVRVTHLLDRELLELVTVAGGELRPGLGTSDAAAPRRFAALPLTTARHLPLVTAPADTQSTEE
jgi:tRNA 2-thiocytidine biosynthesis protein TtcA